MAEEQFYNFSFRFWSVLLYFNFDLYVHTLSRAKTAHECLFVAIVVPVVYLYIYSSLSLSRPVVSALLYIRKSSPRRLKSFINAGVSLSLSAEIECICRLYHATLSGQFHSGAMNFFFYSVTYPKKKKKKPPVDRESEY